MLSERTPGTIRTGGRSLQIAFTGGSLGGCDDDAGDEPRHRTAAPATISLTRVDGVIRRPHGSALAAARP